MKRGRQEEEEEEEEEDKDGMATCCTASTLADGLTLWRTDLPLIIARTRRDQILPENSLVVPGAILLVALLCGSTAVLLGPLIIGHEKGSLLERSSRWSSRARWGAGDAILSLWLGPATRFAVTA